MDNETAWQNKDVTSKLLAERLKEKSFRVYGLDIPKIVQVLPTNLPEIWANELCIDNLFLLEDGTLAIVDYESTYNEENKVKYLQYISRVLERYRREGKLKVKIRMIVIYTADVNPDKVSDIYDIGALRMEIQSAYLSKIDSEETMRLLRERVLAGEKLTEEEMMQFIILPLTYKGKENKRAAVKEAIKLARIIEGDAQTFILAGIIVFASKYLDGSMKEEIGGMFDMTILDEYYWEKQEKAVAEATIKAKAEGEEVGRAEERAELEEKHAKAIIREELEHKTPKMRIIQKLCRYLEITESKAKEYYVLVTRTKTINKV